MSLVRRNNGLRWRAAAGGRHRTCSPSFPPNSTTTAGAGGRSPPPITNMEERAMRESDHLVIVGGGFSGVALAAELARRGAGPRMTIVEGGARLGRGLAYGTLNASHL